MCAIGLAVPPGFTITTDTCNAFHDNGANESAARHTKLRSGNFGVLTTGYAPNGSGSALRLLRRGLSCVDVRNGPFRCVGPRLNSVLLARPARSRRGVLPQGRCLSPSAHQDPRVLRRRVGPAVSADSSFLSPQRANCRRDAGTRSSRR